MIRGRSVLRIILLLVQWAALTGAGVVVTYVLLVLVVGGFLTGWGQSFYVYRVEPSPDRRVSVVSRGDFGGGPTISTVSDVYLVGASFDQKVDIGRFDHGGWTPGDGWQESRVMNICMLRYAFGGSFKSSAAVQTAEGVAVVRFAANGPANCDEATPP